MIVLSPVNAVSVARERAESAVVNVMPACGACGSYFVAWVDARLSMMRVARSVSPLFAKDVIHCSRPGCEQFAVYQVLFFSGVFRYYCRRDVAPHIETAVEVTR